MHIALFGATGRVGQLVLTKLLASGLEVTALVHHTPLTLENPNLTTIHGDTQNTSDITQVLANTQAVIVVLSSSAAAESMPHIINTMQQQGIRRIICLTGSAAYRTTDELGFGDMLGRRVMSMLIGRNRLLAGESMLEQLAVSDLDWTCVRSPAMLRWGSPRYRLTQHLKPLLATIPREAVAASIVDQLSDDTWVGSAPTIRRG